MFDGQFNFQPLIEMNSLLLKQHFYLRDFQIIEGRLPQCRTLLIHERGFEDVIFTHLAVSFRYC